MAAALEPSYDRDKYWSDEKDRPPYHFKKSHPWDPGLHSLGFSWFSLALYARVGGSDVPANEFGSLECSAVLLLMAVTLYMSLCASVYSTMKAAGGYVKPTRPQRRGTLQLRSAVNVQSFMQRIEALKIPFVMGIS